MKISEMIERINKNLGSGMYTYAELEGYMDESIDELNEALYANLPLVSEIYNASFSSYTAEELAWMALDPENNKFIENSIENPYLRIPDRYLRNYLCYDVAYRVLENEDEDQDVYAPKFMHAQKWLRRIVAEYGNTIMTDTESILINGDAEEVLALDEDVETNPYWEY